MILSTPWMLLQPFMTSIHHQRSVSHEILQFVTPVFKSPFSSFRTIANILNNTCPVFHLSTSYTSIKPFLLFHAKSVGFFDCTNPVTVAQVCLSAKNTGTFVRYDFLDNTVMIIPGIPYSCLGLLFLREQFSPKYSIFRSQIYLQLFRSPWKLIYEFTNVSPLLPESS